MFCEPILDLQLFMFPEHYPEVNISKSTEPKSVFRIVIYPNLWSQKDF